MALHADKTDYKRNVGASKERNQRVFERHWEIGRWNILANDADSPHVLPCESREDNHHILRVRAIHIESYVPGVIGEARRGLQKSSILSIFDSFVKSRVWFIDIKMYLVEKNGLDDLAQV